MSKSIFSKVSFMNLHLKMYHVWLLVGNTVVVYMSGVLNSKLKYQHDLFIFIFLVYVIKVSTGGSKLCKYMLLRLLNIKMFLFRIFFINIATGTGWRLYENKKKNSVILCSSENKVQLNSCRILSWCFWCYSLHLIKTL